MFYVLANFLILALGGLFFWWLSGYDSKLAVYREKKNFIRRGVRCGITLVLLQFLIQELWQYACYRDPIAGLFSIYLSLPLAFLWVGCISNCLARGFVAMIDPEDKRDFDPKQEVRHLDVIGGFIRSGNKTEAIRLCESLKASGEVDLATLELTLEHLGVPQPGAKTVRPLVAASRLRSERKFPEAELILNSLLLENPRNLDAAMMLVRLYAQDLRQLEKAAETLRTLEKQPHISTAYIEFANRSLAEWSNLSPEKTELVEPPKIESIDELVAQGFFGTAVEVLEAKIKEQPQDFAARLKLAEVYGVHCANFPRAEKIVRQIEMNFSPEQVQLAKIKLAEWRKMRPRN